MLRESGRLILRSSRWYQLCYFLAIFHKVILDPAERMISIHHRKWWFYKRTHFVPYDLVEEVGFICNNIPELCGDPFWGDRYEIVWLALQITDSDEFIKLIPVEGEGSKETGILGVLLGDSIVDLRGDHAEAAHDLRLILKKELQP